MKPNETIEILKNEISCVLKAESCDRNCGKCELVRDAGEIIVALELACEAVRKQEMHSKIAMSVFTIICIIAELVITVYGLIFTIRNRIWFFSFVISFIGFVSILYMWRELKDDKES